MSPLSHHFATDSSSLSLRYLSNQANGLSERIENRCGWPWRNSAAFFLKTSPRRAIVPTLRIWRVEVSRPF